MAYMDCMIHALMPAALSFSILLILTMAWYGILQDNQKKLQVGEYYKNPKTQNDKLVHVEAYFTGNPLKARWAVVPILVFLLVMVTLVFIAQLTHSCTDTLSFSIGVFVMIAMVFSFWLGFRICAYSDRRYETCYEQAADKYWEWLSTCDVQQLKKLSSSSELSESSKTVILCYLDEMHPGWTLI